MCVVWVENCLVCAVWTRVVRGSALNCRVKGEVWRCAVMVGNGHEA